MPQGSLDPDEKDATAPDILSFDTSQDLGTFCLDGVIRTFIRNGGLIALGLVPTSSGLSGCDSTTLFTRWQLACKDLSERPQLASRTLITATCGLGLLNPLEAATTFDCAQHISMLLKNFALNRL